MYKLTNTTSIERIADGAIIPNDPMNSDYASYLRWVEEGNAAEPYVEPSKPIPTQVSMVQARLALLEAGHLDAVEAGVTSMPKAAQIEWEFRPTVVRNSPLVVALASVLSLTEIDLDNLFKLADTL